MIVCLILTGIFLVAGYITMGLTGGIILQILRPLFVHVLYPESRELYESETLWAASAIYSLIWPLFIPAGFFMFRVFRERLGNTVGTALSITLLAALVVGTAHFVIRKNLY
jgi:hypothetical protein